MLVTAHYADGTEEDVTAQTSFQSNESVVASVEEGAVLKAGPIPGERPPSWLATWDSIATCRVAIPLPGEVSPDYYAAAPTK
jgi:hypothetical protein